MDLEEQQEAIFTSHAFPVDPGAAVHLSLWIRSEGVAPAEAVRVRLQAFGGGRDLGWVRHEGSIELLTTDGTHAWQHFSLTIPVGNVPAEAEEVLVYLRGEAGATGEVWFDEVEVAASVAPALPRGEMEPDEERVPRGAPLLAADHPWLVPVGNAPTVAVGTGAPFYVGPAAMPVVLTAPQEGGTLHWQIRDYWSNVVARGSDDAATVQISVAPMGYFEVQAQFTDAGGGVLGSVRTSLAHYEAEPATNLGNDYAFGSWIQHNDWLDEAGANWTRVGHGWKYLEPQQGRPNEPLWARQDAEIAAFHQRGLQMIYLFFRVPDWAGPNGKVFHPAYEEAFRAYVRASVLRYRDVIDVWETMNEPYIPELYEGTLEDIMRWHRVVKEEVEALDPGALVIGPCLSPREPHLVRQMQQLLDMGIAEELDGIAIHTYGGLEADGFREDLRRYKRLFAAYGKPDFPLFITEHGLSVDPQPADERVQAQHLVRTLLLANEVGVRALIWHMMAWPEGPIPWMRNYGIVRAEAGSERRAPRPAFVAAGVAAQQLGNATFVRRWEDVPPGVEVHEYQREGAPLLVAWTWQHRSWAYTFPGVKAAWVTDIMGNKGREEAADGSLSILLTPNPRYVQPIP